MLRPLEFAAPAVTFQIGKAPFVERAMLTSSWQSPEGLVGHCLVNITEQKQTLKLSLDARGAAEWGKTEIDLYHAGSLERATLYRGVALPQQHTLELAPLEAAFIVLRPAK